MIARAHFAPAVTCLLLLGACSGEEETGAPGPAERSEESAIEDAAEMLDERPQAEPTVQNTSDAEPR